MATKADFTEEEWETLSKGVTGAGMYVSLSDRDFTDSFGEARALAKHLGAERGSQSTLVRDLATVHRSGFGFRTSPAELESQTLEALRSSISILQAKAPDEVEPYKELVLGAAHDVAEAKGGVADVEAAAIEKITAALG
jgi:hypothetical protein